MLLSLEVSERASKIGSGINNLVTGQFVDMPTRRLPTHRLVSLWTEQVADWTARGLVKL